MNREQCQTIDGRDIYRKLALIDRAIKAPRRKLRFERELEDQFETETGPARARVLAFQGIALVFLYNSLLFLDWFALSDTFGLAVLIRVGLVGGTVALAAGITLRNPSPFVREGLLALATLVSTAGVLILITASSSPLRQNYHYGIVFLMLFALAIQHLRFRFAVPTVIGILIVHLISVESIDTLNQLDKVAAIALTQGLGAFALHADLVFERQERRTWLLSVRDRLRALQFEELSEMDPLTGLGNRRALDRAVVALREDGDRVDDIAVAIVDIDHFKAYNDAYGHLAGDDCIRRVAGLLTSEARKHGDTVFRFGGEEFLILLPATETDTAVHVCERIRQTVEAAAIPHLNSRYNGRLTVSIGVAGERMDAAFDIGALAFGADTALYQAKSNGRNQVVPPPHEITAERQKVS